MPGTHLPYPEEFRHQIVQLVRSGRTIAELAREFEPTEYTIRKWVQQADWDEGRRDDGPTMSKAEEVRRLKPRGPAARSRARDPEKSCSLVRAGDRLDPVRGFEFVSAHQATYPKF